MLTLELIFIFFNKLPILGCFLSSIPSFIQSSKIMRSRGSRQFFQSLYGLTINYNSGIWHFYVSTIVTTIFINKIIRSGWPPGTVLFLRFLLTFGIVSMSCCNFLIKCSIFISIKIRINKIICSGKTPETVFCKQNKMISIGNFWL